MAWRWVIRSSDLKEILGTSASARALLTFSSLMVAVMLIASAVLLIDLRHQQLVHAKGEIASLSRILGEQTARTFEGVSLTMRSAQERLTDEIGVRLALDSFPVGLLLKARSAGLPQVKSMFVVNRDGLVVNSSRSDFISNLDVTDRSFFGLARNGEGDEIFVSNPEKAKVDDQWAFYVSVPLRDSDGRFRGVLAASISIDYFESLYDGIDLDFVGSIQLLNRKGTLLAESPHHQMLLGQANPQASAVAELLNEQQPSLETFETLGERKFVAYRLVANNPLVIRVSIDESSALAPWYRMAWPIIVGLAFVVFFFAVTSVILLRSIKRREALETALEESDERLRHLVQSSVDAIICLDADKRFVLFNHAAESLFGISADQTIGQMWADWLVTNLPEPQREALDRHLQAAFCAKSGASLVGVVELVHGQAVFPVELRLLSTRFRGELLVTVVFRDLTERQQAEKALKETNSQLQALTAALSDVREEEQLRISRELHDELGQLLTGIRLEVSWLGGRLQPEQKLLADKVSSIKAQIDRSVAAVRRMASELRPLALDDLGFVDAAAWYVDQFAERTGLAVSLDLPPSDRGPDGAVAVALFRVLQEALTNVARHAQATRVEIRLELRGREWILGISDDGTGFAADTVRRGGIGLIGMRERIQILKGRFSISSSSDTGTRIEAIAPVSMDGASDDENLSSSAGG